MRTLFAKVIVTLSLSMSVALAHAQNPADCYEVKDEGVKTQLEFCEAHVGCRMVMSFHRTCVKVRSFMDRIKENVGDGVRTFFGNKKEITSEHVFQSSLTPELKEATSKDKGWQTAAQQIADNVNKSGKQTATGGSGAAAWTYVGDVKENKPSGWGTMFTGDGTILRGEFREGVPQGQVDGLLPDAGLRQTGSHQNGLLNGRAYQYSRGEMYVGSYRDGQRDGFGTATSADGRRFEGSFKEGSINGPGTKYRADGSVEERGVFAQGGKLSNGQRLDPQGRVLENITAGNLYAQAEQVSRDEQSRLRAEAEAKRKRDADDAAKRQAELQAKQDALAREQREFQAKLGNANPGELFSLADELAAKGDSEKARLVRRTLLSKYPNHPLAATAAQQMATMNSASANSANTGVASVSVQSGGSGSCWEILAKKEKEYEAINRRPVPAGATPGLMRVMWMTEDSIKVIDANCAGDMKAAKYRGELQNSYNQAKTACEQLTAGGQCKGNAFDASGPAANTATDNFNNAAAAAAAAAANESKKVKDIQDFADALKKLADTVQNRSGSGGAASGRTCNRRGNEVCTQQ